MKEQHRRIVVKIGTSLLTGSISQAGDSSRTVLGSLVRDMAELVSDGYEVLIVTSGAIGAGTQKMGWKVRPDEIRKKQATAAIGQVSLMQTYQKLFEHHNINVAQLLLTRSDFEDRRRYLNARATILTLLELGIVPVINENDTVATDEIQFGDNDRLSALVASKIHAELLIILTDVDGLYLRHRSSKSWDHAKNQIISLVPKITPEIESMAGKYSGDRFGTGGMTSKIEAAKIATASGVTTLVANGSVPGVIRTIAEGGNPGTKFIPVKSLSAKERWILFGASPKGEILIDQGALAALRDSGKSLLPAGILKVNGSFRKGEVVRVLIDRDMELARGVVQYSAELVEVMKGKKSGEIRKTLNLPGSSFEVIHRDSLIILP